MEGKFLVTLVAIGVGGISSIDTLEITITNAPPSATIFMSTQHALEEELVTLQAINLLDTPNDLPNLKYRWTFGNGDTAEGAEIQYAWSSAGTYTVTLYVSDDQNSIHYETAEIMISNGLPTANFEILTPLNPTGIYTAQEDEILEFDASTSFDTEADYEDLRYYWDFGDGTVGRGKGLHHSYPESGLYTVKLLVVDDDGASSSVEKFIEILNTPPIVAILDEDLILWEGETHVFAVDSADSPTDFQRLHYYWSSGESGWQASHAWTDDWEGQVSVQVQDPEGLTATDTINVAVLNVPPKISLSKAYMEGNLTLRAAGTPNNAITLKVLGNGIVAANFTLDRIPGDPKSQAITLPFLFDLAVEWRIEISYSTRETGANPTWLTFTTSDHRSFTYFHNFVVEQESTWTWNFYPKEYLFSWGWPIIFNGTIFDPSSDSITGQVLLNSNPILDIFHPADGSWPAEIPFSVSIKASNSFQLEVTAADDDGGTDYVKIDVENFFGRIFIRHLAPQFEISVPTQIFEDFTGEFLSFVYDVFPPEDLLYVWNFGDGTSLSGANISHTYSTSGSYVVQLTIQNPYCSATRGYLIQVVNYVPYVDIFGLSEGPEDEVLKFEAQITETSSDKLDLHYFWTFGDGYSEVGPKVTHSYAQSNSYTLTLAVCDDNGAVGTQTIPIIIYDEAPIIDGPFGFQTVEGNTILAEVDVYDSVVDEPYLLYSWKYNSETIFSRIFTTREDDGAYNAIFTVVDPDTTSVTNEISLVFINQPPSISASSFLVYGARTSLDLKAFASDSYVDMADLTYEWVLDDEPVPDGQGIFSSITLNCDATRTYIGHVAVTDDSSHQSYSDFTVYVFLDSDGDGMTNEFEIISGSSPDQSDTDGDLLPDSYEYETTHTSANNRDTDGDGLWDGLDPTANTGEVILGTNPLNPDTDGDGLTDWEEIIVGWTVTVNGVSGPVYSNPLKIDTDSDGLTDYQEKNPSGTAQVTDPTKANTDGDEQSDFEEAGLAVAIDSDQDGVSDDDERTHITEYVPVKHEYFLTSDSAWVNALELTGSLESTQVDDDANSWRGQALGQPSPLTTVTFTGVFDTIITQYNEFVINMSVSAADAAAYFQLWDGDSWVTHTTFSETTTNAIIVVRITEENAADWIHGETLQFRLVSGNNKDELNPDLCNSYLEIFYAHIEGFLKYTLRSDSLPASSWVNAEEIQGTLANTFIDDANSWSGQTKAQTPPLPIIFTGVFNSITTPNNRLTVRVRVSATDSAASFQLWNGEVWDAYKTFSVSTTAYVTLNEPTVAEYIHDGTLMFRIVSGYNKKSNGMVFFESYVEILYALIEEITTQEIFRSDPALADTDGDGLSDGEEYYPSNDGWTTNPRNPDTDHDHLLDSAESVSLTREYGTRERFSRVKGPDGWGILESFFPLEFTLSTSQEFFFDAIINGGQAKNATVFVGFSSTTDLRINHILIKVAGIIVAEELNPTLDEPAGGLEGTYFFKGYDITQKTTRFSGEWWLLIDAEPLHPEDCEPLDEYSILLEEFKGEILLPLNPTNPDWDQDGLWDGDELNASVSGWLTNPRNWDSDGDMWSDREEIYNYATNPLSADTDGDGAIDPDDRDPLYNLILQINVFQGHFDDADWTRRLAVVLKVGKEALATPDKWADSDKVLKGIFKREVFTTATFNYEYYFDIDDDLASVDIGLELWKISWVWDTRLLAKSYTYSLGTAADANPTETVTVSDSDGDWVTFAASTRALQRVNTLAIYEEGNFYNGHYPAIERFTVIIFRVEGTPSPQDPIKAGVNVILVPVSIFIRTHLHALLESTDSADHPVELGTGSSSGIEAEFYGIDAASETVSQHIEGLIVKGLKEDENGDQDYVTPAEALAILTYVLCNETGDLTYSAYLCDEVGMVERLGLAADIIDLVPLDAESMKSDPLGAMPKGFWDWLASLFLNILKFVLLIALAPILLAIALVAALITIGITLLGPILDAIVRAVLKVIILIYITASCLHHFILSDKIFFEINQFYFIYWLKSISSIYPFLKVMRLFKNFNSILNN